LEGEYKEKKIKIKNKIWIHTYTRSLFLFLSIFVYADINASSMIGHIISMNLCTQLCGKIWNRQFDELQSQRAVIRVTTTLFPKIFCYYSFINDSMNIQLSIFFLLSQFH
jgi:hypothetical protein